MTSLKLNPFTWIQEAFISTQENIIATSGLDSAVYFIFYETVLKVFLSGMVLLPVLLTFSASDTITKSSNGTRTSTFNYFHQWSIRHIDENSPRLYAFVAATYWVSLFTINLLENAYNRITDLRASSFMSPEIRPEEFVVLVRDIPIPSQGESRKEQVDSYFKKIYPDSYYGSLLFPDNNEVEEIWKQLEGYRNKLSRAEAIYAESKGNELEEYRPTTKTGFLGLIGERVDSIYYYHEKVNELVPKLKVQQKIALKGNQHPSALVFFTSRITAASAAQSLIGRKVTEWTVMDAPESRQLLQSALVINGTSRQLDIYIQYMYVIWMIMINLIPMAFLSAFTTLENLGELFPFLKFHVVDKYAIKMILEAFLPQIILLVVMAIIPRMLLPISKINGIPSLSCAERDAAGKTFFIFTVLIIGITGFVTLITSWKEIEENPGVFVSILANTLPINATFFVTFVCFKSFVVYGLELSRLVTLATLYLKKYFSKSEAYVGERCTPVSLGYATRLPGDMLVFAVVLSYSLISPIIVPVGVLYFLIGWLVLRNQYF